jgi:RNA polymerase sigma-70 factor (ECF subfamily)
MPAAKTKRRSPALLWSRETSMPSSERDPLLWGLAAGDEESFGALYDRFGERLYRVAASVLGSREDAEDAVQDLFAALVRSRKRLPLVDDLEAYLFVSLRRAVARRLMKRGRQPTAWDPKALDAASADAPAAQPGEDRQRLSWALGQLPAAQREVVALKFEGGLTFAQIGQVIGTSLNTAASRYRYALERLRALLEENA